MPNCPIFFKFLILWGHRMIGLQGAAVKLAETKGVPLDRLTVADLQTLHPSFADDVTELWSYESR